jgi:hypothetical protein
VCLVDLSRRGERVSTKTKRVFCFYKWLSTDKWLRQLAETIEGAVPVRSQFLCLYQQERNKVASVPLFTRLGRLFWICSYRRYAAPEAPDKDDHTSTVSTKNNNINMFFFSYTDEIPSVELVCWFCEIFEYSWIWFCRSVGKILIPPDNDDGSCM